MLRPSFRCQAIWATFPIPGIFWLRCDMRLYSKETGGTWLAAKDLDDGHGTITDRGSQRLVQSFLTDCLTSSNLIVLTGLGTSLCVNDAAAQTSQRGAPTMADLWEAAKQKAEGAFDGILKLVGYQPSAGQENIETLLSKCKVAQDFLPEGDDAQKKVGTFVAETETIIREKCGFVSALTPLPLHETFVARIGRRSARKPRTKLFTTNYDKCFEEAARRRRFVVIDGFSYTVPPTYDPGNFSYDVVRRDRSGDAPDFIENVFHIYKLHGSVDWTREGGEILKRDLTTTPLLIYPRASKYEQAFEAPYLDMMAAFQAALRQPETALLVIGFGFRDDHIARPIMAAVQANLSLRVVVCDPGFFPKHQDDQDSHRLESPDLTNAYHRRLKALVDEGDPRIALIKAPFEELVPEVPDLVAESDRERHAERFRRLKDFEEQAGQKK